MKLRINENKEELYSFPFTDSKDVYNKMKEYAKADREMFMVMYLNAQNHVLDCELHSIGMVDSSAVYPKEVFRGALLANACAIICIHNHPSGSVTPSASDNEITEAIVKAGVILQVNVLDHVIIGTEGYYSYADEGRLGEMEQEAGKSPCQGHVAEGKKAVDCPCPRCKKENTLPPEEFEDGCLGVTVECPGCNCWYEVNGMVARELFNIKIKPFREVKA